MSRETSISPAVIISGDTLALDPAIRRRINTEAEKIQKHYPTVSVTLRVGISEEFDQVKGHRIRCELSADLPGRRQLMVREANKEAFAAITAVFSAAKRQSRRISWRGRQLGDGASGKIRIAGT